MDVDAGSQMLVNECQKGNPLLPFIRNVRWVFTREIVADYAVNTTGALFVSVKYHHRHPKVSSICCNCCSDLLLQHISRRIDEVGRSYRLRVLLVLMDDENCLTALQDLNRIAFSQSFTLILSSSNAECGRYLETLKSYENKPSASIQEKEETEFLPRLTKTLTSVRSVNKTDVLTLLDVFGSFSGICRASSEQLVLCPGIGEKKVKRLHQALHQPFERKKAKVVSDGEQREEQGEQAQLLS